MYTEKEIRRIIREELCKTITDHHKRQLQEQGETGGANVQLIKKGLSIAFPDWEGDIDSLSLQTSFVDEFAGLVKNAMKAAESGKLVKAATASEKTTKAIE
jgi:hypothetical protein